MGKKKTIAWDDLVPEVTIDPSLNKYASMSLFPEKLARVKKKLKKAKIPQLLLKTSEKHLSENHGEPGSATRIEFEKRAKSFALQELLLNGPVFSEEQIKQIEETHKSINKWRTGDSKISG